MMGQDEIVNAVLNAGMLLLLMFGGPRASRMLSDRVQGAVKEATAEIVEEMERFRADAIVITDRQDRTDEKVDEIHDVVVNQILPIVAEGTRDNGEGNPTYG
jgi:hypothetical protein